MRHNGFTLVELLVVIVIMGVLASLATLNFSAMKRKSDIEQQTKELYSAIVGARAAAMQAKQRQALYFGPKQYVFKIYTSSNYNIPTAWKTINSVNLKYPIQRLDTSGSLINLDVTSDVIDIDSNGFTNNLMTLVVTPVEINSGSNCLIVHLARTNIGRMASANSCTIK